MSRFMDGQWSRHALVDNDGWGESSADPADYWSEKPDFVFEGTTLVRMNHPYVTVTGLVVLAPRPLKSDPSLVDLARLRKAKSKLQQRALQLLDESTTMNEQGE